MTPRSPLRRLPLAAVLCLVALSPGCVRQQIQAARRDANRDLRNHLATYAQADATPAQTARANELRDKALRAEQVERGYRAGDDHGGAVLYSAAGMGFIHGTGYLLFGLPGQAIAYSFQGDNPARAVKLMENQSSPDARRRGMNDLLRWDFAHGGPYVRRYRQIARADPDPYVRSVAIRSLNRCRDPEARPLFVDALSDPNDRVRLEAAKALANLPTPAAAEPLIKMVTNPEEDRDIRIAAAAALNHYKKIEVARALASRLQERDFSVAWQARESLRKLTKKDFRYNEARWLEYLSGPDKPFG